MVEITELNEALENAQKERIAAVKAFQSGKGSEWEAISTSLGELALQALDPNITTADKELIEGHREYLRKTLRNL